MDAETGAARAAPIDRVESVAVRSGGRGARRGAVAGAIVGGAVTALAISGVNGLVGGDPFSAGDYVKTGITSAGF